MNFYEAITKLNVLSSYDTTKEKREQFKECINVIIKEKENYDRVMCEPILIIMKKLIKLEIIEKHYIYDDKESRFNLIKPITIEDDEILKEVIKL